MEEKSLSRTFNDFLKTKINEARKTLTIVIMDYKMKLLHLKENLVLFHNILHLNKDSNLIESHLLRFKINNLALVCKISQIQ